MVIIVTDQVHQQQSLQTLIIQLVAAIVVEEEVLQKIGDPLMVIEESPGLSSRERDILERRCGFNESGKPETWPAICAATGLSRETVRQIFLRAIAKYRKALQLPPEG